MNERIVDEETLIRVIECLAGAIHPTLPFSTVAELLNKLQQSKSYENNYKEEQNK